MQIPTTDQLRDRIDSGETGEKVSMPDPAAAPLGTDAEAGGAPPTPQERAMEARASTKLPRSALPSISGVPVYFGLVLVIGIIITTITLLAPA